MRLIVSLFPSGRRLPADIGELLSDVLVRDGVPLNLYCGRRGVCGKCFVEILSGEVPPGDESERDLAREKNLGLGRHRLACRLRVQGDLVVRVPEQALIPRARILTRGRGREIPLDPMVRKVTVRSVRPDLQSPRALLDGLKAGLGLSALRVVPEALFEAAGVLSEALESDSPVTAVLGAGDELRG
ncbi:MAG TPA: 2Fe-2S iron-sulfur cluster-binding protein, partial [Candidatus Aminicenantes bacterium]|nr:2Fe-2S iron-sulfur cluster-binding protein [Candidatus Aminicenantes bacterium]